MHTHIYVLIHTYTCIHVCKYTYTHIHLYVFICTYIYVYMYAFIYICTNTYIYKCKYISICKQIRKQTNTHTHTHTHTCRKSCALWPSILRFGAKSFPAKNNVNMVPVASLMWFEGHIILGSGVPLGVSKMCP